jgi:hypothetical protein
MENMKERERGRRVLLAMQPFSCPLLFLSFFPDKGMARLRRVILIAVLTVLITAPPEAEGDGKERCQNFGGALFSFSLSPSLSLSLPLSLSLYLSLFLSSPLPLFLFLSLSTSSASYTYRLFHHRRH